MTTRKQFLVGTSAAVATAIVPVHAAAFVHSGHHCNGAAPLRWIQRPMAALDAGGANAATGSSSTMLSIALQRDGVGSFRGPFAFYQGRRLVPIAEAYAQLRTLLRDVDSDVEHEVDLRLLVALSALSVTLDNKPIGITNAYRTAATNKRLIVTDHAAQKSRHLFGDAVDCYVDGYSYETVFLAAAGCPYAGGLGLYTDHVHVDTWDVRTW
jgi:hypothetical protein